jgi:hypothetical protein
MPVAPDLMRVRGPRRLRLVALLTVLVIGAAVIVLMQVVGDGAHVRGGLIEVSFTTPDRTEQAAVSRECGMDRQSQLSDTRGRYSFAPSRQATVFACLDHSPVVRTVGILG